MIALNELKALSTTRGPCLTIFLPLQDGFSHVAKAETRLVAAAQRADELLAQQGMDAGNRARFLRPILNLAQHTPLAGHSGSFIIFRAPGSTRASFWPDALDTTIKLDDEFFVLPLLRRLTSRESFWLLALSMRNVRLLRGTATDLTEVELPAALPHSLRAAEGFATPELSLDGRSAPGRSNGQSGAVHFGTSSLHDKQPAYLHDFFKQIERAIKHTVEASGEPLIVAAVQREMAIYRNVNTYASLLSVAIHGSPDSMTDTILHQRGLAILRQSLAGLDETALVTIESAAGRGLLEDEVKGILEAARKGQVERLYLATPDHADEEAVNSAALAVLRNSGTVVCGELPQGRTAAAILRYREPALTAV